MGRYVAFLSLSFYSDGPTRKFYKPIDSQRGTYLYNPFRCIDDGLTMYYLTNNHSKLYRSSAAVVVVLLYLHAKDSLTSRLTRVPWNQKLVIMIVIIKPDADRLCPGCFRDENPNPFDHSKKMANNNNSNTNNFLIRR